MAIPARLLPSPGGRCYVPLPSKPPTRPNTAAHRPHRDGEGLVRRMTARPGNAHQARLLRLLRDGGPNSRARLGDRVELSRSKLAVEIDRLLETGLVVADGLAASAAAAAPTTSASTPDSASWASTSARPPSTSPSPTPNWRSSATSTSRWTCARAPSRSSSGSCPWRRSSGPPGGRKGSTAPASAYPDRSASPRASPWRPRSCPAGTASRYGRRSARNSAARSSSTTT